MAYGMTVPLDGVSLAEHRPWLEELATLGYTDLWSSEADGTDAFTPLAVAAAWTPTLRLGTAIVPAYTRGPALLAQSVAALAEAAPGRFAFGIGTSSNVIVESWNGLTFDRPYQRTRDVIRFLRSALSGERVDAAFDTFGVRGFRLARPPSVVPPILVAALRPGMLHLAGREGDGAILNWLAADDVAKAVAEVGPGKEIVARIFVCPSSDAATVRAQARRLLAAYLNVPVYAAFHEWLGRGPALRPMWDAWGSGDRKAALAAIPDDVVDDLVLHGTPDQVRAKVAAYVANGVTTPVLAVVPLAGIDPREAARRLAPSS
ncbi:MAG TPA: LLM class F420-dependent oxidoreductase [Acidimicrobiales bacterium]|nr:LLM class F420-dependent oxidoreductase [Acidimicrobiales bacterium]